MKTPMTTLAAILAGLVVASCADDRMTTADHGPVRTKATALGQVLTDRDGMTLYTYKDDPLGGSACFGRCARTWPPLVAPPGAQASGNLTIIEREDGLRQYAQDGRALYLWAKDRAPGDVTGHAKGDVWFAARP